MSKLLKNNKGFMLVEVIVVTVVVATVMISLYTLFNRVYNSYDKKSTYNDIDSIYALKMLEDYFIDKIDSDMELNKLIQNTTTFKEIKCESDNFCDNLFKEYNINSIYIVKNNENSLKELKNNVTHETFKDYVDYLMNIGIHTTNFLEDNKVYSELLVVETYTIKDEESKDILNKYAYLPIRKNK